VFEHVDPRSPIPLYEQIASRIRVAVAAEELECGQSLPSVRQLATSLRINPATVVQAYRELEKLGFVERRHGSGTFVCDISPDTKRQERIRSAEQLVRNLMDEAARLGVNGADLQEALAKQISRRRK
jgi:GntR family transcriptional regulator